MHEHYFVEPKDYKDSTFEKIAILREENKILKSRIDVLETFIDQIIEKWKEMKNEWQSLCTGQ